MFDAIDGLQAVAVAAHDDHVETVGAQIEGGVIGCVHGMSVTAMMPTKFDQWKVLLWPRTYQLEMLPSR